MRNFFLLFCGNCVPLRQKKMEDTMNYFRIGLIATAVVLAVVAIVAWFRSRK